MAMPHETWQKTATLGERKAVAAEVTRRMGGHDARTDSAASRRRLQLKLDFEQMKRNAFQA